jgi:hypothetical protein
VLSVFSLLALDILAESCLGETVNIKVRHARSEPLKRGSQGPRGPGAWCLAWYGDGDNGDFSKIREKLEHTNGPMVGGREPGGSVGASCVMKGRGPSGFQGPVS